LKGVIGDYKQPEGEQTKQPADKGQDSATQKR
jgi:hypothetical protein